MSSVDKGGRIFLVVVQRLEPLETIKDSRSPFPSVTNQVTDALVVGVIHCAHRDNSLVLPIVISTSCRIIVILFTGKKSMVFGFGHDSGTVSTPLAIGSRLKQRYHDRPIASILVRDNTVQSTDTTTFPKQRTFQSLAADPVPSSSSVARNDLLVHLVVVPKVTFGVSTVSDEFAKLGVSYWANCTLERIDSRLTAGKFVVPHKPSSSLLFGRCTKVHLTGRNADRDFTQSSTFCGRGKSKF
mmetsp:Transcript_51723/g.88757  ORF Transcript_51723/g.88757 Transcript_51723/m.88757 type:complete len:242 (-) Transcript_51723:783-1508(-)